MKLHALHDRPTELDHYANRHLVPFIAWEHLDDLNASSMAKEAKKNEKIWARDPKTAYHYALYFLNDPFPLGEPVIAKDAHFKHLYNTFLQRMNLK